jgi:hypothetical protein
MRWCSRSSSVALAAALAGAAVLVPAACVESTSSRRGGPAGGGGDPSTGPSSGPGTVTPGFDKRALLPPISTRRRLSTP